MTSTSPQRAAPNGRALSLREGMAWASTGNAIYVACQYGMLVVIAKLGSTEAVGQYALALGITAPIIVATQMQLRQLQVTDSRGATPFADYLKHRVLWTAVAALGIVAAALVYGGTTGAVVAAIGAAKAFESVSDILQGHMQRRERMDLVAVSMTVRGLGSVVVMAVVMAATGSLPLATLCMASFWGLMLPLDFQLRRRADGAANAPGADSAGAWPEVGRLTRLAAPLAVGSTLISVSANMPRYFLDAFYGKEAVALFSVAAMPLALASVLLGSLTQATLPRAAANYQDGDLQGFRTIAGRLTAVNVLFGIVGAVAAWLFGRPVISLLFTPAYAEAVPAIVIMSIGLAIGGMGAYGALLLAAARMFRLQLVNVLVMVALQLVACWLLVRGWGVAGAAYSELIRYGAAAAFLLIAAAIVTRRHHPRAMTARQAVILEEPSTW